MVQAGAGDPVVAPGQLCGYSRRDDLPGRRRLAADSAGELDWRFPVRSGAIFLLLVSPTATLEAQSLAREREVEQVLAQLVESYGVSGMEGPVRATVERLLPSGLGRETDSAGNLWVTLG